MTQADFKNNNSPSGANYNFAIENCLSDIFNYWNSVKEKLDFLNVQDIDIFPVTAYMRELRNRVQHDLYPERIVTAKKGPISMEKGITSYAFPIFEVGQPIRLTEDDIEALVLEVRAQHDPYLIRYINNFLKTQAAAIP